MSKLAQAQGIPAGVDAIRAAIDRLGKFEGTAREIIGLTRLMNQLESTLWRRCHGEAIVRVRIPADLSCTGEARWKDMAIDAEVAPLVAALQAAGIDMRSSCSGHGEREGHIALEDGRMLLVLPAREARVYFAHAEAIHVCGYLWDVAQKAAEREEDGA